MSEDYNGKIHEKVNTILKKIESLLYTLAGEKHLEVVSVTRWRWDQPEVMLVWLQSDNIYRNIVAHVTPEGPGYYKVDIESNAWLDKDVEHGNLKTGGRVRKWKNFGLNNPLRQVNVTNFDQQKEKLLNQIKKYYEEVCGLKEDGLDRNAELSQL